MSSSGNELDASRSPKSKGIVPQSTNVEAMKSTFLNKMSQMGAKSGAMNTLLKKKALGMTFRNGNAKVFKAKLKLKKPLDIAKLPKLSTYDDELSSSPEKRSSTSSTDEESEDNKKMNESTKKIKQTDHSKKSPKNKIKIISNTVITQNRINMKNGKEKKKSEAISSSSDDGTSTNSADESSDSDKSSKLMRKIENGNKGTSKLEHEDDAERSSEEGKTPKEKGNEEKETNAAQFLNQGDSDDSDASIDRRNSVLSESQYISTGKTQKALEDFASSNQLQAAKFLDKFDLLTDISNEDEVFLLKVPKQIDCDLLIGKKIALTNSQLLQLSDVNFSITYDEDDKSHLYILGQRKDQLSIRQVLTKGSIAINEHFKCEDVKPIKLEGSTEKGEKVAFPVDLTQRHPIFGVKYREHIELADDTKLMLRNLLAKSCLLSEGVETQVCNVKPQKTNKKNNVNEENKATQFNDVEPDFLFNSNETQKKKILKKADKDKQFDITSIITSFGENVSREKKKEDNADITQDSDQNNAAKSPRKKNKRKSYEHTSAVSDKSPEEESYIDESAHKRKKKKHKHIGDDKFTENGMEMNSLLGKSHEKDDEINDTTDKSHKKKKNKHKRNDSEKLFDNKIDMDSLLGQSHEELAQIYEKSAKNGMEMYSSLDKSHEKDDQMNETTDKSHKKKKNKHKRNDSEKLFDNKIDMESLLGQSHEEAAQLYDSTSTPKKKKKSKHKRDESKEGLSNDADIDSLFGKLPEKSCVDENIDKSAKKKRHKKSKGEKALSNVDGDSLGKVHKKSKKQHLQGEVDKAMHVIMDGIRSPEFIKAHNEIANSTMCSPSKHKVVLDINESIIEPFQRSKSKHAEPANEVNNEKKEKKRKRSHSVYIDDAPGIDESVNLQKSIKISKRRPTIV